MNMKTSKAQSLMKIIRLFRQGKELTRQEIARELNMSMPTVLHNIEELMNKDIIVETGEKASTGGRRARTLALNNQSGYGIGIQITRKHVRYALTDLSGQVVHFLKIDHPYQDKPAWYRTLGSKLIDFILETGVSEEAVIGVGISFPGIIDQENQMILHSHVFDIKNVSLDRFYKCILRPLVIVNDANCACYAEQREEEDSFLYISLNESVGGALMLDKTLYTGRHWQAGEVGHVIIHPKGKMCYCGKEGCADAYLATSVLLGEDQDLDGFFEKLDAGDREAKKIWEDYMDNLAILVSNMRMVLDMNIVLGGDVGARMDPYILELSGRIEEYDLFSRNVDYITACRCKKHIFSVGAALSAIDHFDYRILE